MRIVEAGLAAAATLWAAGCCFAIVAYSPADLSPGSVSQEYLWALAAGGATWLAATCRGCLPDPKVSLLCRLALPAAVVGGFVLAHQNAELLLDMQCLIAAPAANSTDCALRAAHGDGGPVS